MLIKIAKAPFLEGHPNTSYILIPDVTEITHAKTQPEYFSTNESLKTFLDNAENYGEHKDIIFNYDFYHELISGGTQVQTPPLSDERFYRMNQIEYIRNNQRESILFDTIAYICNDKGETLEKCFAGGILNK